MIGLMEELSKLVRSEIREERYRIFRWMSRSLNLSTRFMVPEENGRDELGTDGSVTVGQEALRRSVEKSLATTSK